MTRMSDSTTPEQLINLVKGWPSTSLLPKAAISQAAQAVLADTTVSNNGLLYGPDEGHEPLREAVAAWNSNFYAPGHAITKENIAITGGASQNLGCIMQVFTDPLYTRNVWIVAPAYMLAFRIFEDNGFAGKMRAVPEDEEGLDIEFLRSELTKSEKKATAEGKDEAHLKPKKSYRKSYRHVIYCVPTFANPSSRTMSLARRRDLVRCAREFDALIICDDVYDQLQWPADVSSNVATTLKSAHLPRVWDIDATLDGGPERTGADGFGNAMSNGSFSKIVGPGLRVGWAEGSKEFAYGISQTGTTCSGGAPSQLTSTYITRLLKSGFIDSHIQGTLQKAYRSRYRTLIEAIQTNLVPIGVTLPQSKRNVVGGFFVWLTLPDDTIAAAFAQRCKEEENVAVAPGGIFEVPGDTSITFEHSVRLCFAWEDEDMMRLGVEKMAAVLRRMLKGVGAKPKYDARMLGK